MKAILNMYDSSLENVEVGVGDYALHSNMVLL